MRRRNEFSSKTKREAFQRSGGFCEGSGPRYGLAHGRRCMADLKHGVEYDHANPDANSKDASLANCVCVCAACHRFKTAKVDVPMIAKTKRQADKRINIKRTKGRGFQKIPPGYRWDWQRRRAVKIEDSNARD